MRILLNIKRNQKNLIDKNNYSLKIYNNAEIIKHRENNIVHL
jgi:hypothetical protein